MSGTLGESFALAGSEQSIREQAIAFAQGGVPVFPVSGILLQNGANACTCGRPLGNGPEECKRPGKHPTTKHGFQDATTDLKVVDQWFSPYSRWNLAIPTGNGLVVIDVDPKNDGLETLEAFEGWTQGVSLPLTLRVRTGSGGLHLLYKLSGSIRVPSRNAVLPGIDIKADGGYVVAPPSTHLSGSHYAWENPDQPITPAPDDLINWLLTARAGTSSNGGGRAGDYDFTQGGTLGQRDSFANDLAFRLRKSGTTWEAAVAQMRSAWEAMEQKPDDRFEWDEAMFKLTRVWSTVTPDTELTQSQVAWASRFSIGGAIINESVTGTGTATLGIPRPRAASPGENDPTDEGDPPPGGGGAGGGDQPAEPADGGDPSDGGENLTDLGNAKRFVRLHGRFVRYVPEESRWYIWDRNRLKQDTLGEVLSLGELVIDDIRAEALRVDIEMAQRDRIATHARNTESAGKMLSMLKLAEHQTAILVNQLDADPWRLVVQNGTLDLRKGTLVDSLPEHLNTKMAAVSFDPDATCPQWEQHIKLITDGDQELASYLQRACGYALTGLVDEQKFFFLWGAGQNGKNVFMETIVGMMGDYGAVAQEGLLTSSGDEHPTALASLRGARLVMADETGVGKKFNDARIKMITGSAKVRARYMRQDFFEYDSTMKLWILGNNKPTVSDTSHGMWRRMQLVPFTAQIPDDRRILHYETILRAEWSGILNWCLSGLAGWMQLEGLGAPDAVVNAVAEYKSEEDVLGQFMNDCFVRSADGFVSNSVMYRAYRQWAVDRGLKVESAIALGKKIGQLGLKATSKRTEVKVERGWLGLSLQEFVTLWPFG